jgi:hypothetical protein
MRGEVANAARRSLPRPPQGGTVEVTCQTSDDGVNAANTKTLAIKAGTLN